MTEEELKNQINRSKQEFDRLSRELDTATKAWKQVWSAYQSQSRILELEVKDAENSLVSAEQTLAHVLAKSDQGLVGSQEVRDTEARLSTAVVRREKARELLHLWQELEKNEPEMNPDWKPAETLKP
jgi:chromosome segregation ATPase